MKKLYVETTKGILYFEEVKDTDIYVDDDKVMHFGALGAANLTDFISYQFIEVKENE